MPRIITQTMENAHPYLPLPSPTHTHTHTHHLAILCARYTPERVGDPPRHFGHSQMGVVGAMATLWVDEMWTKSHGHVTYGLLVTRVDDAGQILRCGIFFLLV